MKFKALGGFGEVGRNGVLIDPNGEEIVFDYGLNVEEGTPPIKVQPKSVFVSHAHLDHIGSVPSLFFSGTPSIFSTVSTFDLGELILKDSIKVAKANGKSPLFGDKQLELMKMNQHRVTYGQQFEVGKALVDVIDAGHIPGSCMFLVKLFKKNILYTGDLKLKPTQLLAGARIENLEKVDVLFTESTYSNRLHPDRAETERKLIEAVEDTIGNGGIAIIPSFAVGRAAEVAMILDRIAGSIPVYLDGMAREATDIALRYPEFLRDPAALKKALEDVYPLYTEEERAEALKKPCAIITTGGCVDGGPSASYIKKLYNRPECSLIFVGFQIPETAGKVLQDTGRFVQNGFDQKVKMKTEFLDFSAHADRGELLEFIKKVTPEKIFVMHGDQCENFAAELNGMGFDSAAPKNGDIGEI